MRGTISDVNSSGRKRKINLRSQFFDDEVNYFKSFDGTPIYFEQFGSGEPPIVFVHGWTQNHSIWERPVYDLSKKFRTVTMDNRGMGYSGKPNSKYDFDEFSSDLRELILKLDLKSAVLVGWSMGVSISLRYYERFGADRISKIALINGPIKLTSDAKFSHSNMTTSDLEKILKDRTDNRPARESKFLGRGFHRPNPVATAWLTQVALMTPMHVAVRCVENQAKLDMRDVLSKITVPTLVGYGRYDPFYPVSLGRYIRDSVKNSKLVIYEKSGHYPFLEESEKFSRDIEELALS